MHFFPFLTFSALSLLQKDECPQIVDLRFQCFILPQSVKDYIFLQKQLVKPFFTAVSVQNIPFPLRLPCRRESL